MRRYCILIFFAFAGLVSYGQMVVENTMSAKDLVNHILLGDGVEATNITINGLSANTISSQFGFFDATASNIGLQKGIILATGGVSVAVGPNDLPTAHVPVPANEKYDYEPDLAAIMAPAVLKDVAVVEFDFVATGDTLRFKYVFASEEYNEHVCSPYNDAFGFFISGPGITGIYENNANNFATIPGTNIPVAINTINRGVAGDFGSASICNAASPQWQADSIYFVNNENNTSPNATQFDGFTIPMMVKVPVICGETYHIKMAIADGNDDKNDSAVFIEAGSFTSTPPLVADLEILNPNDQDLAVEGCSTYRFTLSRADTTVQTTYYIKPVGWSDANTLIPSLPYSVTLYPNQHTLSLDVPIATNHQYEGLRNYEIHFLEPGACSLDTSITVVETPVLDYPPLNVQYPDTVWLNCVETGNLQIEVSGGYPPYDIQWSDPNYQGFNIDVNPNEWEILTAVITDQCQINTETIQTLVKRETYPPLQVVVPQSITYNCIKPVQIIPQISGGQGQYTVMWYQNDTLIHSGSSLNKPVENDADLKVVVSDLCSETVVKFIELQELIIPISLNLQETYTGTCKTEFTMIPSVSGGIGSLTYHWKVNNKEVSQAPIFITQFPATSYVTLEIEDACQNLAVANSIVFIQTTPLQASLPTDTAICVNEILRLEPDVKWGEGSYTYFWNNIKTDSPVFKEPLSKSTAITFTVVDECKDTVTQICEVEVKDARADFDFQPDFPHKPLVNYSTKNLTYFWFFADGSTDYEPEPMVSFDILEKGSTTLIVQNDLGCEDEITKTFIPDVRIYIPNAFTPDGDGINDMFKAVGENIERFEMRIFNRWGLEIFYIDDITQGWGGEGADEDHTHGAGIYSYKYIAIDKFGRRKEGVGTLHLLK